MQNPFSILRFNHLFYYCSLYELLLSQSTHTVTCMREFLKHNCSAVFSLHSHWRFLCMSIKSDWHLLIASIFFLRVGVYSPWYCIFVNYTVLKLYKIHRYLEIASPLEGRHWWICLDDDYLKEHRGKTIRIFLLIAKRMNSFSENIKCPGFYNFNYRKYKRS